LTSLIVYIIFIQITSKLTTAKTGLNILPTKIVLMYFVNFLKMKKYNTYKILLVFLALTIIRTELQITPVYTQPVIEEWVRRYPDSGYGFSGFGGVTDDIIVDEKGNSYVTGLAVLNTNDYYCCTIKYKSNGDTAWTRLYGGENTQAGRRNHVIAIDKSFNVYATGGEWVSGNSTDFLTIKYDSSGNQKWVKHYNGLANDEDGATAIVIDKAGNIYVAGYSSYGGNSFVYCTIKYNATGDQVWIRNFGIPSPSSQPYAMTIDDFSNIYITGMNNSKATTVSYDSSGNLRWGLSYNNQGAQANSIALDSSNNVFITGFLYSGDSLFPGSTYITIKYTSSGVQDWVRKYSYSSVQYPCDNKAYSVNVDKAGNVYVSGNAQFTNLPKDYYGIIKYSNSGDTIWERHLQVRAIFYVMETTIDSYSNIYATSGAADTALYSKSNYFTFKYDSSGTLLWTKRYNPNAPLDSYSSCIAVDKFGDVFISGFAGNPKSVEQDMCTVKYSQPLYGIKKIENAVPGEYKLYQNYPNPFNPNTKIKFDIIQGVRNPGSEVRLIIYDILGRELETLVNEQLSSGTYEVEWNASNFSSGIYFYQLKIDDFTETKKMVLIK
jgi:hypothetical protein